jgi:hypothetical protein
MATVTLYRPVGPRELELIKDSGWRAYEFGFDRTVIRSAVLCYLCLRR